MRSSEFVEKSYHTNKIFDVWSKLTNNQATRTNKVYYSYKHKQK